MPLSPSPSAPPLLHVLHTLAHLPHFPPSSDPPLCALPQAYYSNALRVAVLESYGQVKVTSAQTGLPLPRVYVKAYSRRSPTGPANFFKDGYTDIRGRFDYASLNTDELTRAHRFALLISSETLGCVVRDARPPKQ